MIPLTLRLKKEKHRKIARAQDLIIECLYSIFNNAVLHGGTSIWRCYNGVRFSEDIDVYIPKDPQKIERLFKEFEKSGFIINKKKIGNNTIYSVLSLNKTIVRFEVLFKKINGILKEYESCDGNLKTIYTLSQEELIKEKINTYLKRYKIRDLYDIFFLLRYIKDKKAIRKELIQLTKNFKKPVDEKELKILILEGLVPETEKMLHYIESFI